MHCFKRYFYIFFSFEVRYKCTFDTVKHTSFSQWSTAVVSAGNTMFSIFMYHGIYKVLRSTLQDTFYLQKEKKKTW